MIHNKKFLKKLQKNLILRRFQIITLEVFLKTQVKLN